MNEFNELKEWLRIDGDEEDATLTSLLSASQLIIKQATGVTQADLQGNQEALELYKLVQKLFITDLYENRSGSTRTSPVFISLCTQLGALKGVEGDLS